MLIWAPERTSSSSASFQLFKGNSSGEQIVGLKTVDRLRKAATLESTPALDKEYLVTCLLTSWIMNSARE